MHDEATSATSTPPVSSPSAIAAFRFAFGDPNWMLNALIGWLFSLIPIIGQIVVFGWCAEITQRLARRHPNPIPKLELGDFSYHLNRGVAPFVVALVFQLVVGAVAGVLWGATGAAVMLVGSVAGDPVVTAVVGALLGGLALVVSLLLGPIPGSAQCLAEVSTNVTEGFAVGRVLELARRTYFVQIFQGIVFSFVALALVSLGLVACFVGVYLVTTTLHVAGTHLRWQLYEYYIARGGTAVATPPPLPMPSEVR